MGSFNITTGNTWPYFTCTKCGCTVIDGYQNTPDTVILGGCVPTPEKGKAMNMVIYQAMVKFQQKLIDNYGKPIGLEILQAFFQMMSEIINEMQRKEG